MAILICGGKEAGTSVLEIIDTIVRYAWNWHENKTY